MVSIAGIVKPLLAGLSSVGRAMDILDVEWLAWVDVCDDLAVAISAKLELPELLNAALFRRGVETGRVVAESEAVLEGECIAFSYVGIRMLNAPRKQ